MNTYRVNQLSKKRNIPLRQQTTKEDIIFMKKCKMDCDASNVKQKSSAQAEGGQGTVSGGTASTKPELQPRGLQPEGTFVITEFNPSFPKEEERQAK